MYIGMACSCGSLLPASRFPLAHAFLPVFGSQVPEVFARFQVFDFKVFVAGDRGAFCNGHA